MRQVRTIRYKDIAADLRRRLTAGEYTAGRLLPSESELSGSYSASRVTVRKALEELRAEGLVDSRQGFGWFVAEPPVRQPLARLATIEGQLEAEGRRGPRAAIGLRVAHTTRTGSTPRSGKSDGIRSADLLCACPIQPRPRTAMPIRVRMSHPFAVGTRPVAEVQGSRGSGGWSSHAVRIQ